jgi:prevent-host-death family protein
MSETLTLAEVELSELVSRVHSQHERVTVTVYGRPSAVETIAVLSDSDALRQLGR